MLVLGIAAMTAITCLMTGIAAVRTGQVADLKRELAQVRARYEGLCSVPTDATVSFSASNRGHSVAFYEDPRTGEFRSRECRGSRVVDASNASPEQAMRIARALADPSKGH